MCKSKRLIVGLLLVCLIFSLSGCGFIDTLKSKFSKADIEITRDDVKGVADAAIDKAADVVTDPRVQQAAEDSVQFILNKAEPAFEGLTLGKETPLSSGEELTLYEALDSEDPEPEDPDGIEDETPEETEPLEETPSSVAPTEETKFPNTGIFIEDD